MARKQNSRISTRLSTEDDPDEDDGGPSIGKEIVRELGETHWEAR